LLAAIGAGCWTAVREFLAAREYRLALEDTKRYDPEAALGHLRRSLDYRPRSAPAHLLAARLYRQLEDYDRAEEHLQRCQELQGGTSEEVQLENLMLRAARGDAEAVLDPLLPYLKEKRPESPLVLEAMSVGFLRRYQRAPASKAVEDWIELEPDNPWAYFARGNLAADAQNASQARADYEKSLELLPGSIRVRRALLLMLIYLGEFDKAIKEIERVLEREPDNMELLLRLAQCHIELAGREQWHYQRADELLDKVLERDPDNYQAHYHKGVIALYQDRLPEALQHLRQAVRLNRLQPQHHLQLSKVCRRLGLTAEADEHLKQFKSLDEDLYRLNLLTRNLEERRDAALFYEVATIYFRHGRMSEALRSLKWALKLNPNHAPSHRLFVDYYTRVGEPEMANYHRSLIAGH
jgi:tetratricopeptide (TPR) repeat protein